MSVLIKGMKMPKSCEDCPFGWYTRTGDKFCLTMIRGWQSNCPLIELPPHGRLIDAEWLKLAIAITLEHLTSHPLMSNKEIMLKSAFKTLELMVDDAPTIIEAEVE